MFFKRIPDKAILQSHKKITVGGMKFVIRRINPLMDLEAEKIPQIFTAHLSRRKPPDSPEQLPEAALSKINEDIKAIVYAGVVSPKLVPIGKGDQRGNEDGITADDLFRSPDIGMRLYIEIVNHSMNEFKGTRGLFFSLTRKLWLSMFLRKNMEGLRLRWFSRAGVIQ